MFVKKFFFSVQQKTHQYNGLQHRESEYKIISAQAILLNITNLVCKSVKERMTLLTEMCVFRYRSSEKY